MRFVDRTGQQYGHLTVIGKGERKYFPCGTWATTWICKCDCGNTTTVLAENLRSGHTQSCGCRKMEGARKALLIHGDSANKCGTRLYRIWRSMKQRCIDRGCPAYKDYGGRGILICEEWFDYTKFKEWALSNGYSEELSIDRIDVNGNYEPSNCRWATRIEQANNKRNNHRITIGDRTQTLAQWMRELNKSEYQILRTYC